jgi:hypothetical protein
VVKRLAWKASRSCKRDAWVRFPFSQQRLTFIDNINYYIKILRGRAEVARKAHNLEVGGSSPSPATKLKLVIKNIVDCAWLFVRPLITYIAWLLGGGLTLIRFAGSVRIRCTLQTSS